MVKIEIDNTGRSNFEISMTLSMLSLRLSCSPDGGMVSPDIFDCNTHKVGTITVDDKTPEQAARTD